MRKPALAEKDFLNPEEAIKLFNLSRRKFYRLVKEGKQLGFMALYGSRKLEPTDKLPVGKKPCLSLRELEKQIGYDLDTLSDPMGKNITVGELVERYLCIKIGVKPNTLAN